MSWLKRLFDWMTSRVENSKTHKFFSHLSAKLSDVFHWLTDTSQKRWTVAFVCALVLSAICYVLDNQPYNKLEDSRLFYYLERPFQPKTKAYDTNVCFINISHDRQLVYVNPDDHDAGNTDITDRRKLLQFLRKIEDDSVKYKFIMMDIRFDRDLQTEYDDSLFHQIARMPNIVIAHHYYGEEDDQIADTVLRPFVGMSDYQIKGNLTNFSRYTFLQNKRPSLALKMYDDCLGQPTSIEQWGDIPVYFSDHHLCANAPMLYITGNIYSIMNLPAPEEDNDMTLFDYMASYPYYEDLGADFLLLDGRDWNADMDGRYIVVADFENDIHDTYVGKVPGAYITWMAFKYLVGGHHILSWTYIFLSVIGYMLIIYFLFYIDGVANKPEYKDNKVAQSLLSAVRWLGSVGLLYLVTFLFYRFFQMRFNITFPIMFITIVINFIIQISNKHEKSITTDGDPIAAVQ